MSTAKAELKALLGVGCSELFGIINPSLVLNLVDNKKNTAPNENKQNRCPQLHQCLPENEVIPEEIVLELGYVKYQG
jgi:hypothetical protein